MNYQKSFSGWLGEFGAEATYEAIGEISKKLISYYKLHTAPGQKLVIGYDTRVYSKRIAQYIATLSSQMGLKVFFSNAPTPSAVLVESCVRKKCIGAIVVTGDDAESWDIGLRAYKANGMSIKEELLNVDISSTSNEQNPFVHWVKKGFVEEFDPMICYQNRIQQTLNLSEHSPAVNWMMFNPLFGSGTTIMEQLFIQNKVDGYTTNGDFTTQVHSILPKPSLHIQDTHTDMLGYNCSIGFIMSPDGFDFECVTETHTLSKTEIITLLVEMHKESDEPLLISSKWASELSDTTASCVTLIEEKQFNIALEEYNFSLAIDAEGRVYANSIPVPDALYVGLCFFSGVNSEKYQSTIEEFVAETIN